MSNAWEKVCERGRKWSGLGEHEVIERGVAHRALEVRTDGGGFRRRSSESLIIIPVDLLLGFVVVGSVVQSAADPVAVARHGCSQSAAGGGFRTERIDEDACGPKEEGVCVSKHAIYTNVHDMKRRMSVHMHAYDKRGCLCKCVYMKKVNARVPSIQMCMEKPIGKGILAVDVKRHRTVPGNAGNRVHPVQCSVVCVWVIYNMV